MVENKKGKESIKQKGRKKTDIMERTSEREVRNGESAQYLQLER